MTTTPEPLSCERLNEIRALDADATPGPWFLDPEGAFGAETLVAHVGGYERLIGSLGFGAGEQADADRAFGLAARTVVPELLAEAERLRAALERAVRHAVRMEDERDEWRSDAWKQGTEVKRLRTELDTAHEAAETPVVSEGCVR